MCNLRFRTNSAAIVIVLAILTALIPNPTAAQDNGEADSAYFMQATYEPAGIGRVRMHVPIALYSDQYADWAGLTINWTGAATVHSVNAFYTGNTQNLVFYHNIDDTIMQITTGFFSEGGGLAPTIATQKFLEVIFDVGMGDSIYLSFLDGANPAIGNLNYWWAPTYFLPDTFLVAVDTLAMASGDADCSGIVTISDAVYLINYIFSGGEAPYDSNAADTDASCIVTISDAVYLINYIFAGGPAPLPGCVVP